MARKGSRKKVKGAADHGKVVQELSRFYELEEKVWNVDPFRSLIGTILSQRTRDENTARASKALFEVYPDVRKLASSDIKKVEKLIRPSGFYRVKARLVREVAKDLLSSFDGKVPDNIEDLLTLPGVGRKTANCLLVYGFNKRAIPVDTHVHRISNRLGWVSTRTPEETEQELVRSLPERYWLAVNDLLVTHGQQICRPIRPRCQDCPVNNICPKKISTTGKGKGGKKRRPDTL